MSKSKRSKIKRPKPDNSCQTSEQLEKRAQDALNRHHIKDAIQLYKSLIKQESRPQWQQALAECYRLRANELMTKNMYKEAAAILENLDQVPGAGGIFQNDQSIETYFICLLRMGSVNKAAAYYTQHADKLSDSVQKQLLPHFAARFLIGDQACVKAFAESSVLRKHGSLVLEALNAYAKGEDAEVQVILKQIPFRSPYRDFCLALKALLALHDSPLEAQRILEKVSAGSPFRGFVDRLLLAAKTDDLALSALTAFDKKTQQFIGELKGWAPHAADIISKLPDAAKSNQPKLQLRFLLSHHNLLPKGVLHKACMSLLVHYQHKAEGIKSFQQCFGRLSYFDHYRLFALESEYERDYEEAVECWLKCTQAMDHLTGLQKAALLRHMAELDIHGMPDYIVSPDVDAFQWLEESLTHDPEHKATHLKLIQAYRGKPRLKNDYQSCVDRALKQFPNDRDILSCAIIAAQSKKAFKKSTQYAKALLALDPINLFAFEALQEGHLAHARKQALQGKLHIVEKELQAAQDLKSSRLPRASLHALRALAAYLKNDITQAKTIIQNWQQQTPSPLRDRLVLLMEAQRLDLNAGKVVTQLAGPFKLPDQTDSKQALETIGQLNLYLDQHLYVAPLLKLIEPGLKAAMKGLKSQNDYTLACKSLASATAYDLLKWVAGLAKKQYQDAVLFEFYLVLAEVKGRPAAVSERQFMTLLDLVERADRQGDRAASVTVSGFLREAKAASTPRRLFNPFKDMNFADLFDDDEFEDDEFEDDEFEDDEFGDFDPEAALAEMAEVFANMPPEMQEMLRQALLDEMPVKKKPGKPPQGSKRK